MLKHFVTLFLLGILFGCGSEPEQNEQPDEQDETVFDEKVQTIEKAKQVEKLTSDRMQQLEEADEKEQE
ncbi:MAG: hypothetical protein AAF438_23935 [Pseudomonadota bacterium]